MFKIVFCDVLPRKMIVDRRFRGTCCLQHQGDEWDFKFSRWRVWSSQLSFGMYCRVKDCRPTFQRYVLPPSSGRWVRFQVLTAASMKFTIVFWDVLPCKMIVDRRFRGAYCLNHLGSDDNHFTRQYIPEDISGLLSYLTTLFQLQRFVEWYKWLWCFRLIRRRVRRSSGMLRIVLGIGWRFRAAYYLHHQGDK
jgi:hypothetical protein